MTIKQFNEAVRLTEKYPDVDTTCFLGFGLSDFKPVYVTLEQVAALINYQARMLNGVFDQEALQEVKMYKHRFNII